MHSSVDCGYIYKGIKETKKIKKQYDANWHPKARRSFKIHHQTVRPQQAEQTVMCTTYYLIVEWTVSSSNKCLSKIRLLMSLSSSLLSLTLYGFDKDGLVKM